MKLYVDTSDVVFEVGKPFAAKRDPEGRQRKERSGEQRLLWVVQLVAFAADGVETLNVTVASDGEPPRLTQKQSVTPVGLEAVPWAKDKRRRSLSVPSRSSRWRRSRPPRRPRDRASHEIEDHDHVSADHARCAGLCVR